LLGDASVELGTTASLVEAGGGTSLVSGREEVGAGTVEGVGWLLDTVTPGEVTVVVAGRAFGADGVVTCACPVCFFPGVGTIVIVSPGR
jgi:hypothetical protein